MTGSQVIIIFSVVSGVVALIAFCWALSQRQLRLSEAAKFTFLEDDSDLVALDGHKPVQRWHVRVFMTVMAGIFLFIGWSIWLTIMTAKHIPAQGAASGMHYGGSRKE